MGLVVLSLLVAALLLLILLYHSLLYSYLVISNLTLAVTSHRLSPFFFEDRTFSYCHIHLTTNSLNSKKTYPELGIRKFYPRFEFS